MHIRWEETRSAKFFAGACDSVSATIGMRFRCFDHMSSFRTKITYIIKVGKDLVPEFIIHPIF